MHHAAPHQPNEHSGRAASGPHYGIEVKNLIKTTAAAAVLGGMALLGSGCSAAESPAAAPTHAPVKYEVAEGVDELPEVAKDARSLDGVSTLMYPRQFVYSIDKEAFSNHSNFRATDPEHKGLDQYDNIPEGEYLPSGDSAPLLEVMIGSDGKLRYKSHEQGYGKTQVETLILDAVQDAAPMLEASLQTGAVSQVNIRIFEPDQYPDHPSWEPTEAGLYIPRDCTPGAGGKPSIYYYLPSTPGTTIDAEAVSLILSHEAGHALLGQGERIPPSAEQIESFTKACNTLEQGALADMKDDAYFVLRGLRDLMDTTPAEYRPAFQAVIDGIKNGTYQSLQSIEGTGPLVEAVPSCFLQDGL